MKNLLKCLFLWSCISCNNNSTESKKIDLVADTTVLSPAQQAERWKNWNLDSTEKRIKAHEESVRQTERKDDSIQKRFQQARKLLKPLAHQLPKMNRSVLKENFYKHFVGDYNGEKATMNMTFGFANLWGEQYLEIVIATPHQMYLFYESNPLDSLEKNAYLVLAPIYGEYGSRIEMTATLNETGDFQGWTMDLKTLKPISCHFKAENTEGVTDLEYVVRVERQKVHITQVVFSESHIVPKDSVSGLNKLLKRSQFNSIWKENRILFDSVSTEYLKELKGYSNNSDCGRCKLVAHSREEVVMYNDMNHFVIAKSFYEHDGISYGNFEGCFLQIDAQRQKILTEKDVLIENWRVKIANAFIKNGENEEHAQTIASRVKYGYFTNSGVVFIGTGNHGWYSWQNFIPFEYMFEVLKSDFKKKYVKNTIKN